MSSDGKGNDLPLICRVGMQFRFLDLQARFSGYFEGSPDHWKVRAGAEKIRLSELVQALLGETTESTRPEGVPDVELESIELRFDSDENTVIQGTVKLLSPGDSGENGPKFKMGDYELSLFQIDFYYEKTAENIEAQISVWGEPQFPLFEGITWQDFYFAFKFYQEEEKKGEWILGGNATLDIFDRKGVYLGAQYKSTEDEQSFKFTIGDYGALGEWAAKNRLDGKARELLWSELKTKGYLDQHGGRTEKSKTSVIELSDAFQEQRDEIVAALLEPSEPLIKIDEVASIDFKYISLEFSKQKQNGWRWGFKTEVSLKVKNIFTLENGELGFEYEKEKQKLTFACKEANTVARIPYVEISKDSLEPLDKELIACVCLEKLTITRENNQWAFKGDSLFILGGLPAPLNKIFQEECHGICEIDNREAKIRVTDLFEPVPIPNIFDEIPVIRELRKIKGLEDFLNMGKGVAHLKEMRLEIGDEIAFGVTMAIGLPSNLNQALGMKKNGFIKTYDGKAVVDNDSLLEFDLEIGTDGISGLLLNSPFKPIPGIDEKRRKEWIDVDLDTLFETEGLGGFSIKKPEFSFKAKEGSFHAKGGYEIDQEKGLSIPLAPLKDLLRLLNQDELADKVPVGVPIQSIEFCKWETDEETGKKEKVLNIKAIEDALAWLEIPLPDLIKDILEGLKWLVDRLPDRLKDYLSIKIPKKFTFGIDVTTDGGVSLDIRTSGDPLQTLLLLGPNLLGIRLRKLAFGTAFGGALLKVEFDGEIDYFDLWTLAGSLLLDFDDPVFKDLLPKRDRLHQTVIVEDLLLFIIYQFAIPIPIPVFYEKLAISTVGIDGSEFQLEIHSPRPSLSIKGVFELISDLVKFFTDNDYYFDIDKQLPISFKEENYEPPEDCVTGADANIIFCGGPIYFRLPKFLGITSPKIYLLNDESFEALEDPPIPREIKDELSLLWNQWFSSRDLLSLAVLDKIHKGNERSDEKKSIEQLDSYHEAVLKQVKTLDKEKLGKLIGLNKKHKLFDLRLFLGIILNSVKKKSINYLIQSWDIEHRLGNESISLFSIFDIHVAWALTTPKEFEAEAYRLLLERHRAVSEKENNLEEKNNLPVPLKISPAAELLQLIAENDTEEVVSADVEGIVLFLRGGLQITKYVIFESAFGLMVSGIGGFRTGVSFYGQVANIVDVKLLGFIKISPKSKTETFKLLGKSSLTVLEREVVSGLFELTNERLQINGMLDLFPREFPIALRGHIIAHMSKDEFLLDTGAHFQIGTLRALAHIYMRAKKDENRLSINLIFINSQFKFDFLSQTDFESQASLDVDLYLTALNLIEFSGNLRISIDVSSGFNMEGRSSLRVGFGPDPLITGESALTANLNPVKGYLGVQSNLILRLCFLSSEVRLTGGFAFFAWFSGDHAGDFLLSIGGYHPDFRRPAHYPVVPRVSLNWQIDTYLNVKGSAYFTVTAACIMAGGRLEATWQSGGKKASFLADANFIMAWKPFQYAANVRVAMRLSYTFQFFGTRTLSCELGADLAMWGPEFSGRAVVHIWKISFPISFGDSQYRKPEPIGEWSDFIKDFLPDRSDEDLCKITAPEGVLKDFSKQGQNDSKQGKVYVDWVINPGSLRLTTFSAVPIQKARFVKSDAVSDEAKDLLKPIESKVDFGVAPMNLKHKEFESEQKIWITRNKEDVVNEFTFEEVAQNSPRALWGESMTPDLADSPLVKDTITGFEITPDKAPDPGKTTMFSIDKLMEDRECLEAFVWEKFAAEEEIDLEDTVRRETIVSSLNSAADARLKIIGSFGFQDGDIHLENLSQTTENAFLCAPQILEKYGS